MDQWTISLAGKSAHIGNQCLRKKIADQRKDLLLDHGTRTAAFAVAAMGAADPDVRRCKRPGAA
ncbi:hypothetical protein [Pseudomonas atagonensis]|uniref:hypothetical protein n=1 Tax=Pseudomonas atagonensis TaxID=2609964 RepID=UPI001408DB58|nr:hypothetical protein [Pseudomonas atagonensis]